MFRMRSAPDARSVNPGWIPPARAERRKHSAQRGSDDRDRGRKREGACVRPGIQHDRAPAAGHHGREQIGRPVCERQSSGTAGGGEERGLRQELTHDPAARGAQREPHRDLLLSRARANDQQARKIGARDEQNDAHRGNQNLKRRRKLPAELVQSLSAGINFERLVETESLVGTGCRRARGSKLRPASAQRHARLFW